MIRGLGLYFDKGFWRYTSQVFLLTPHYYFLSYLSEVLCSVQNNWEATLGCGFGPATGFLGYAMPNTCPPASKSVHKKLAALYLLLQAASLHPEASGILQT